MIRTSALVIAALVALIAPASAQTPMSAIDRPVLKAAVTVSGEVVRIGDLVDNAGLVAKIPIFRAPDLGTTGVVTAAQVIAAVQSHALVGLDAGGIEEIRVTRASRVIPIEDIEQQIIAALASQYGVADSKNVALRFERALRTLQVDANATGDIRVSHLGYDARSGRFDAIIDAGHSSSGRVRLSGTAVAMTDVVVLTRNVARGEIVKHSDISVERRTKAEAGPDAVTAADLAVGRALRNAGIAGRPLRSAELGKAELVQRNQFVTIIYEVPGITLTVRGKANEGGAEGDVIEVLNVQSKRNIHGVVTGPGRVLVSSLSAGTITTTQLEKPSSSAVVR